jgi:hypothetical protein
MTGAWTEHEKSWLTQNYPAVGKSAAMRYLGRTEASVRKAASKLGLRISQDSEFWREFQCRAARSKVGKKRPGQSEVIRQLWRTGKIARSAESLRLSATKASQFNAIHGHPRGALGMKHTPEALHKMSLSARAMWSNPDSYCNSDEYRQKLSDRMAGMKPFDTAEQAYSRAKRGRRADIGDTFFRSRWEANYARYLNWMKARGEIHDWRYEPKTFWFEAIKRGVRSYTPDFEIIGTRPQDSYFVEVKGWMDAKSATKIKRMAKYHPSVRLEVCGEKDYRQIERNLGGIIPNWERP